MDSSLVQEGYSDFILKPVANSLWVTVENISVYVRRTDEGVVVDLFPLHLEMENSMASTHASFSEAAERSVAYENELRAGDDGRRAIADWPGLRDGQDGDEKGTEGGS